MEHMQRLCFTARGSDPPRAWGRPSRDLLRRLWPDYDERVRRFHGQGGPVFGPLVLACMHERQARLVNVPVDAGVMARPPSLRQWAWSNQLLAMSLVLQV